MEFCGTLLEHFFINVLVLRKTLNMRELPGLMVPVTWAPFKIKMQDLITKKIIPQKKSMYPVDGLMPAITTSIQIGRQTMSLISCALILRLLMFGRMIITFVESGNGTPDLLDEARWGIDHLLKMQQNDGSVLSIVGFSHASPPSSATGRESIWYSQYFGYIKYSRGLCPGIEGIPFAGDHGIRGPIERTRHKSLGLGSG